jgi:excinuclease ABC subunit B
MYADRITNAMKVAIDETNRRRKIQAEHNKKHKITPTTVKRAIMDLHMGGYESESGGSAMAAVEKAKKYKIDDLDDLRTTIDKMKKQMHAAADDLNFEKAAELRDKVKELEALQLAVG